MSFIRKSQSSSILAKKKRTVKKKPEWDDTTNDLTQMRASPEEIEHRKHLHRSKYSVGVHLHSKHSSKGHKGKGSSPFRSGAAKAKQAAIMKEVLYDQSQLQKVLSKTDQMMAVVKDLFGDDPKRYHGFPNVTTAPDADEADRSKSLVGDHPPIRTRTEVLSDSVMDASALNDILDSDSDGDDRVGGGAPEPIVYHPKLNLERFQQFLAAEERNHTISTISGHAGLSHLGPGPIHSSQIPDSSHDTFQTPTREQHDESIAILRSPKSAINDTGKVKKAKSRVPKEERQANTSSSFNLTDLRKVLECLENEISDYERQTGRRPPAERLRQESFSGYTLAIVESVTKLTRYLRESEMRLQAEITVREQLSQDVLQLRALIDALTSDIIITQEEYGKLSSDFERFKCSTQEEMQRLKVTFDEKADTRQSVYAELASYPPPVLTMTPPRSHSEESSEGYLPPPQPSREVSAIPEHMQSMLSAVLLSPPIRKTRVAEPNRGPQAQNTVEPRRQASLMDIPTCVSGEEDTTYDERHLQSGIPQTKELPPILQQPHVHYQQTDTSYSSTKRTTTSSKPLYTVPMATVSVPRPAPLVQSNVGISLQGSAAQKFGGGGDREVLASQIAELNKQHEEAQRRLQSLLHHQHTSLQQEQLQTSLQQGQQPQVNLHTQQSNPSRSSYSLPQSGQQISSQASGMFIKRDYINQSGEPVPPHSHFSNPQLAHHQPKQQQLQWQLEQQNSNTNGQNQPSLFHQPNTPSTDNHQQLQQHLQSHQQVSGQGTQPTFMHLSVQQIPPQHLLNNPVPQPIISYSSQQPATQPSIYSQSQSIQQQNQQRTRLVLEKESWRQSTSQPEKTQSSGLPKPTLSNRPVRTNAGVISYPVSPPISPISQKSDSMGLMHQTLDSQSSSFVAPAARGITVSIPRMDLDSSGNSPSPPRSVATAH
ncbi:hypothetical protein CHS0354_017286 [Potamilus streckersoni]|uniref:Spindle and centriole-associated protein 1 n=1 Tax=Potamilus streckersoni TaxID=2493646 RepID=A0AAE0SG58_9BIVA|nr:hypothetical protein CHS0354_017286 [Potamilus streckersoni]